MNDNQNTKASEHPSDPEPLKEQETLPTVGSSDTALEEDGSLEEEDGAQEDSPSAAGEPPTPEPARDLATEAAESEVPPEPAGQTPPARTASELDHEDAPAPSVDIAIDDGVMETIVGLAARGVAGLHSLGKPRWLPLTGSARKGVEVEIGSLEAAIDLDVVVEYGVDIRAMTRDLRSRISEQVTRMTNRQVVEVNIHVVGIQLPGQDESTTSRVK